MQLVRNNARRIELRISNTDGTNRIDVASGGSTPPGYPVYALNELAMLGPDDQDVQNDWWVYAPVAAVTVRVYEGFGEKVAGRPGMRGRPPTAPAGNGGDGTAPPPSNGDRGLLPPTLPPGPGATPK